MICYTAEVFAEMLLFVVVMWQGAEIDGSGNVMGGD